MARHRSRRRQPRPGKRPRGPGRRPPNRRFGSRFNPSSQGFTGSVCGPLYQILFPDLKGREKRLFFNGISRNLVVLGAVVAATFVSLVAGPMGALIGIVTAAIGGSYGLVKGRFFRS